ncbi:MAG: hypothetical protein QOE34_2419 [Verrucomicrobiota bacterium]|jgi:hypothetical protein
MTKLITILISCSLALAVSVRAAQPDVPDPKKPAPKSKPVQKQQQLAPRQQHAVTNQHVQSVHPQHQAPAVRTNPKMHDSNVSKQQQKLQTSPAVQSSKKNKLPAAQTNQLPAVQSNQTNKLPAVQSTKSAKMPAVQPNTPGVQSSTLPAVQSNKLPTAPLDKTKVQSIVAQHQNFHAKPNPSIASAQFNQNYQIQGAQNWQGANYQAYQSYHPQWHDQGWWQSHYSNNVFLIGGGWYYWNSGYYYPAWGYDNSAAYYPYDGPIYSGGHRPLDQVVADVQAVLQEQGFYHGEVDGLLGPLTRQALAEYQSSHGLYATETIDQPTLASLGLS